MKFFAFAFVALFVGVSAGPDIQTTNERFVDGIIINMLDDLSNDIKERGLDPFILDEASIDYKLPVTDMLVVDAAIEDVLVEGLSHFQINRINFSVLTTRLQLDLSLPLISAKIGSSSAFVRILTAELAASASGSFAIEEIRVVLDVRVNVGIISGISIRNLSIDFSIKQIKSELNVVLFGHDLSDSLNTFLGETLPNSLEEHREEINTLLEHIVTLIIEELL